MPNYDKSPSMPKAKADSAKRPEMGHSGHQASPQEFGLTGKSTVVDGFPVDSGSAKHFRKPADYNEVGTMAKKFT